MVKPLYNGGGRGKNGYYSPTESIAIGRVDNENKKRRQEAEKKQTVYPRIRTLNEEEIREMDRKRRKVWPYGE